MTHQPLIVGTNENFESTVTVYYYYLGARKDPFKAYYSTFKDKTPSNKLSRPNLNFKSGDLYIIYIPTSDAQSEAQSAAHFLFSS